MAMLQVGGLYNKINQKR